MDIFINSTYWLVAGILLILAEFVIPGGVVAFLGVSCIIVSVCIWLGLISGWMNALLTFFVVSILLLVFIRSFFTRMVEGDSSVGNTDEKLDDFDALVEVTETIGPGDKTGQVRYQGSLWKAIGDGEEIAKGGHARIVTRENITLVVKKTSFVD